MFKIERKPLKKFYEWVGFIFILSVLIYMIWYSIHSIGTIYYEREGYLYSKFVTNSGCQLDNCPNKALANVQNPNDHKWSAWCNTFGCK